MLHVCTPEFVSGCNGLLVQLGGMQTLVSPVCVVAVVVNVIVVFDVVT